MSVRYKDRTSRRGSQRGPFLRHLCPLSSALLQSHCYSWVGSFNPVKPPRGLNLETMQKKLNLTFDKNIKYL